MQINLDHKQFAKASPLGVSPQAIRRGGLASGNRRFARFANGKIKIRRIYYEENADF